MNEESLIFALDIGTRSVVGIVGYGLDGVFHVVDYEQSFHNRRAMRDGQIEDIDLVSRVVTDIKEKLEQRQNVKFTKVSIAAAGRALQTVTSSFEQTLSENGEITNELIQFMESSAIGTAQEKYSLSGFNNDDEGNAYYCVGYSVIGYYLDDYPMSNLEGHRGNTAKVDIIAAFLPFSVVRSLYAVTSRSGLDVDNLTLEPIAAINVIVPPDVRLLNVALVDIGAGTSDIAISKNGSIVAYDMVTIAGDEISEAIMKHFLTDFNTAEEIKISLSDKTKKSDKISFYDILGNAKNTSAAEISELIKPNTEILCSSICERILKINEVPPVAVFLVGGGSLVPNLCQIVAEKLGIPEERVALGGTQGYKYLEICSEELAGPAFVTPLGIGTVSTLYRGCDFFSIMVNERRIMLFSHGSIKVLDALLLAGIKPSRLISVVPPSVTYYINGEKIIDRGTPGKPGQLFVNGENASIDTPVKQGDVVEAIYAENGISPTLALPEIVERFANNLNALVKKVSLNGTEIFSGEDGVFALKTSTQVIKSMDNIQIEYQKLTIEAVEIAVETTPPVQELPLETVAVAEEAAEIPIPSEPKISLRVTLNGRSVLIEGTKEEPPRFLNLLNHVEIDTDNPQGDLILTLNGVSASYMDLLQNGDEASIGWSEDTESQG